MVLKDLVKENGWIKSEWFTTYPMSWENMCNGASAVFNFYDGLEFLSGNRPVSCKDAKQVKELQEDASLTFRGVSKILGVPVSITMFNQTQAVRVMVAMATEEYQNADYKSFNLSLGQYLDSIELRMYR